jgi:hypothetical protein
MFNLEDAISQWRRQMMAAGIKQTSALDELEEHLRCDVERQTCSGLVDEVAFSDAVARIGAATPVREEFKKVRPRVGASFEGWMSAGVAIMVVSTLGICGLAFSVLHMRIVEQIMGFVGVGLILCIACGWRHFISRVPVIRNPTLRLVLLVLFFALAFACPAGLAWLAESWLDPASNAYVIALIWVSLPMPVLIWFAQSFAMNREAREHWGMASSETPARKDRYV